MHGRRRSLLHVVERLSTGFHFCRHVAVPEALFEQGRPQRGQHLRFGAALGRLLFPLALRASLEVSLPGRVLRVGKPRGVVDALRDVPRDDLRHGRPRARAHRPRLRHRLEGGGGDDPLLLPPHPGLQDKDRCDNDINKNIVLNNRALHRPYTLHLLELNIAEPLPLPRGPGHPTDLSLALLLRPVLPYSELRLLPGAPRRQGL